jgi:hypothetical protein
MRKIDSDSFNKEVLQQIYKIKAALDKVNSENVHYFDSDVLEKARSTLQLYEDKNIKFDFNSNVNSIEMNKIRKMIDYLKVRKTSLSTISNLIDLSENSITGASMNIDTKVKVPKYYDGRRSFFYVVYTHPFSGSDPGEYPGIIPKNHTWERWIDPDLSNSQRIKYTIMRNKNEVTLRLMADDDLLRTAYIRYFGIFWRQI